MSPTSSEPSAAAQRLASTRQKLREQQALRRFQRLFWILVAGLAAVSAVFLLLGTLQGPKLSSTSVDPTRVTEQAGQQLRMFANQPLTEVAASQVTVTPSALITVTVQDDLLVVQFEQRLRFGTEYMVEVRDVASPSRDATGTFLTTFTTAPGSILYLDRGEGEDEILRADIAGTGRGDVVHAARGIQNFVPVEGVIVVARDAADGSSLLESVQVGTGVVEQLRLPEGTTVQSLIAPPVGALLGLVLSSVSLDEADAGGDAAPEFDRTLAVIDLAGDRTLTVPTALDGDPISVRFAEFLPDGTTIVAHELDQTVLRVEFGQAGLVLPIDQLPTVYGLSSDATRLTGADSFGGLFLNLETGEEVRLNPSLFEGEIAFGGESVLTAGDLLVQKIAVPDASGGSFRTLVVADDGSGVSRLLVSTIDDRGSIGALALAPNDQYLAVEITPSVEDAVPDGRAVNGRPTSITTVIVDIETGAVVRSLEGFLPTW